MQSADVFGHSEALLEMRARMRDFVDREAIPREHADLAHDIEKLDQVARLLRDKAKTAGLYAPQLPIAHGGLGLSWRERAVILEEAGRSFLGPLAINCAPPDQPNMINLIVNGTPDQRTRYLEPLIRGDIRSCFAMTEPAPGAGSDPSMLKTRARRKPGGWIIDGRKWFISGAVGAAFGCTADDYDRGIAGEKKGRRFF